MEQQMTNAIKIFAKILNDSVPGLVFQLTIVILIIVTPLSLRTHFQLKKIERFLDETTLDSLYCSFARIIYSGGTEYPVMRSFNQKIFPRNTEERYVRDKHGKRKRLYEAFIPIEKGISEEEIARLTAEFEKPDPEALKYDIGDPGRKVMEVKVKMFVVNYGEVRRRLYFYYLDQKKP